MGLINEKRHVSTGKPVCTVCLLDIPQGTEYLRQTFVSDGELWEWKSCPVCEEATELAFADGYEDSTGEMQPEYVWEWAEDVVSIGNRSHAFDVAQELMEKGNDEGL